MPMVSTTLEVFSQTLRWLEQGSPVVLVTVVRTWGSTPRPAGSLLAIQQSTGNLVGSISGGCVEDDMVRQVKAGVFTRPTILKYGISQEHSQRLGLACGGSLEVVIEPLTQVESVKPAVLALTQRQLIARQVNLVTGEVTWQPATREQSLHYDGTQLICVLGPTWQLLLIGAGQVSRYLAEFAEALDYQVVICDPRPEYVSTWQVAGTTVTRQMPDEAVKTFIQDSRSAVVALTHDPKLDDLALLEALPSNAFYVGAMGSQNTSSQRRLRLLSLGIKEEVLTRLHAPVGIPIGSHTPPEIAISILAEMTAVRNKNA
jgi:xanthine dehydrogenase accessory factor